MKRLILVASIALVATAAWATDDARYCGPPARDADGTILRSRQVLRDFQHLYPCPANGQATGACPGWFKDHIVPLVCGGCDAVENLQWLPGEIKTCAGDKCKDRFERRVYCRAPPAADTATDPQPQPPTPQRTEP